MKAPEPTYLPTGCVPFDLVTEGGGLALNSTYMLWCDRGMGKSTLMLSVCRSLADRGSKSLYVASELNSKLVVDMGLTGERYTDLFSIVACTTYTDLENLMWSFFKSDRSLMVIDSITAVVPTKILSEGSVEDYFVGVTSRIRGEFLRLLNGTVQKHNKAVVFLNQARANFDAGWGGESIVPEGGYSNEHYANIIITIRGDTKVQDLVAKDSKKVVGKVGYLYATKNRSASPFVKIPLELFFGKGVSNVYSLTHYAQWKGLIVSKGGWYECSLELGADSVDKVQGKPGRNAWVKEHLNDLYKLFLEDGKDYFQYLSKNEKSEV
jgi:RecA/RadA recombinase